MGHRIKRLQGENARLREEIKKLQGALKEVPKERSKSPIPKSRSQSPFESQERRAHIRKEVLNRLQRNNYVEELPVSARSLPQHGESHYFTSFGYKEEPPKDSDKENPTTYEPQTLDIFEDNPQVLDLEVDNVAFKPKTGKEDIYPRKSTDTLEEALYSERSQESKKSAEEVDWYKEIDTLKADLAEMEQSSLEDDLASSNKFLNPQESTKNYSEKQSFKFSQVSQGEILQESSYDYLGYPEEPQEPQEPQKLQESLPKEPQNKQDSIDHFEETFKPKEEPPKLPLKDSFESYYKSDTSSFSFNKSVTDREKSLLSEIEALREENRILRQQLKPKRQKKKLHRTVEVEPNPFNPKRTLQTAKSFTTLRRKKSKTRCTSKPLTPRFTGKSLERTKSARSLTPSRTRSCKICDHLLSKGYSTFYCSKHGSKSLKSNPGTNNDNQP